MFEQRLIWAAVGVVVVSAVIGAISMVADGPNESLKDKAEKVYQALENRGLDYSVQTFFELVADGYVEEVQLFLDAGINPDIRDNSSRTALMLAAIAGNVRILEVLVAGGASIGLVDANGKTALELAALETNTPAVVYLVRVTNEAREVKSDE